MWVHLGFVDYIDRVNAGDVPDRRPLRLARVFGAFVAPLAQVDDAVLETVMRLWPAAIIGATGILVSLLATRSIRRFP